MTSWLVMKRNCVKHGKSTASRLCYLLEEVTKRGWKDLKALVLLAMDWENNVASGQSDLYALLDEAKEKIELAYKEHDFPPEEQPAEVPIALQDEAKQMVIAEQSDSSFTNSSEEPEQKTEESSTGGIMAKLMTHVKGGHEKEADPKESKMGLAGMELKQ